MRDEPSQSMPEASARGSKWAICQPWWLRDLDEFDGHPRGAECETCDRSIAVDRAWAGRVMCIYCAIECGWVEDAPLGERVRLVIDRGCESAAPEDPARDGTTPNKGLALFSTPGDEG